LATLRWGALGLSLLHLGRPWLAWKAFLGWRRSWLSREVIAFTALSGATGGALAVYGWEWYGRFPLPSPLRTGMHAGIGAGVLLSAWAAVHASAMVYRDTPRALWAMRATLWRFALTALSIGLPAFQLAVPESSPRLFAVLPFALLFKLLLESAVLRHRDGGGDFGPLWKAAQLLLGRFRILRNVRMLLGVAGGMAIPGLLAAGLAPGNPPAWAAAVLVIVTAGELIERYFFFTTAIAPRMPGGRA
jgi:DMSO reductase anchor subunit